MTRLRWLVTLVVTALLATVCAVLPVDRLDAQDGDRRPERPERPDTRLRIGAASRSVLPLVDGRQDYLSAGLPGRDDAFDPGVPIPAWDNGRIAVGNGDSESRWVHDDIRVTAMAIDDRRAREIVVVVASDLYMIFRNDANGIREKAAQLVSRSEARRLKVIVSATHNHHGPDTAFDVNHDWYEYMTDQAAAAVADAVDQPDARDRARRDGRTLVRRHRRHRPADLRPDLAGAPSSRLARPGDRDRGAVEQPSRGDTRLGAAGRGDRGRLRRARPDG